MNRHRQSGMTGTGWLVVLALIGFFSMLIIKMAPVYMEHFSVKTVLESLKEEPMITQKSVGEVRTMIQRRLKVNGVYDMNNDAIKIKKEGGVMDVDITYQVTKHMAGNVDVLISFSDNIKLVAN
ncbi:MAG: DUF4845 domain-containing protein [Gammaproteobacteria bacterium]|nr:DUF4845 domain-containing protein [Gammaproteobacteria bacterium]MCP5407059.1 DUF4845 domain-containing protein [Chromatiaceae bacterium]MCP5445095.1 DUF4845 domain-containing protein [Chromatiaceae bacterium]